MNSYFDLFYFSQPLDDDGWTDGFENGDDMGGGDDFAGVDDDDDDLPMPSTAHHDVELASQNATPADTYEDLVRIVRSHRHT